MRLLLDTNILVPMVDGGGRALPARVLEVVQDEDVTLWASVVSIWEVAIKHRQGRLPLPCPLADLPAALRTLNLSVLPIRTEHVIQSVEPPLATRDPFDRLLIGICAAENLRVVTLDEAMASHPMAWRSASA